MTAKAHTQPVSGFFLFRLSLFYRQTVNVLCEICLRFVKSIEPLFIDYERMMNESLKL